MTEVVPPKPLIPGGWLRVIIFSLLYVITIFLVYKAAFTILEDRGMIQKPEDLSQLLYGDLLWLTVLAGLIIAVLLVYIFRRFIDRDSFSSLGFSTDGYGSDAISGFFLAPAILGLGSLILFLSGNLKWMDIDFDPSSLFISLGIFAMVAFSEELVFRGYILNNLMGSFNKWVALCISAFIFALFHLNADNISFLPVADLFLGGLLLGINYIYTKNLWFAFFLHLSWNYFQGPLLGFKVSSLPVQSLLQSELKGSPLLTGGGFGFEGSFIDTALTVSALLILFLIYEKKSRAESSLKIKIVP
jgi:uncharacterized protein